VDHIAEEGSPVVTISFDELTTITGGYSSFIIGCTEVF